MTWSYYWKWKYHLWELCAFKQVMPKFKIKISSLWTLCFILKWAHLEEHFTISSGNSNSYITHTYDTESKIHSNCRRKIPLWQIQNIKASNVQLLCDFLKSRLQVSEVLVCEIIKTIQLNNWKRNPRIQRVFHTYGLWFILLQWLATSSDLELTESLP